MINYLQFLSEKIGLKNGELEIDYNNEVLRDTDIDTKFGKGKRRIPLVTSFKMFNGESISVYSAYVYNNKNYEAVRKLKTETDFNKIESFIKRTSIYINSLLKEENIDVIVIPKNTSVLLNGIAENLSNKISHFPCLVLDVIEKVDLDDIIIEIPRTVKNRTYIFKHIFDALEKMRQNRSVFKMKEIYGEYRNFLSTTHKINNAESIKNKRVLVLDDIITSNKTIYDILEVLYTNGAKDIKVCTVFKHR